MEKFYSDRDYEIEIDVEEDSCEEREDQDIESSSWSFEISVSWWYSNLSPEIALIAWLMTHEKDASRINFLLIICLIECFDRLYLWKMSIEIVDVMIE